MDVLTLFNMLKSNPVQVLSQRFNLPSNLNNPQDIIQHLLNSGQISQEQVNRAMQMRNNPMIQQLLHRK